jgi:hypothetical protein
MNVLINLTPHDIHVKEGETITTYPATGDVARVSVTNEVIGTANGAPISRPVYGKVEGLPAYQKQGMYYIVSMLVRSAMPERKDLLSPDSGPTAKRDDRGQIEYVCGWLSN